MNTLIEHIRLYKNRDAALVCLTAYTTPMAQSIAPHVDLILVGDSVGTVLYGMDDTTGVTLDMMIAHGKAVMRAKPDVPVIVDMPFGSYEESDEHALASAQRAMSETGAHGVKLEGGVDMASRIKMLIDNNIPVMAHIGLQPQSVIKDGGYKIKGRGDAQIEALLEDAKAVEAAGAFAIVIEGTVAEVAERITKAVSIPTIGIGASVACDGQILVIDDLLGAHHGHLPKFAKRYAHLTQDIDAAVKLFAQDVRTRRFPDDAHIYKK